MDSPRRPSCTTFDFDALLAKLGGDEDFVRGLLGVALRSNASLPDELRAAGTDGDYANIARLAHKVKGTAGDLVAAQLHARARDAEIAARASSPDALMLNQDLAVELERFLAELTTVAGTPD